MNTNCVTFWVLLIVTLFFIVLMITGFLNESPDVAHMSFLMLMMVGFFGWFLIAGISYITSKDSPYLAKLIKTDYSVLIMDEQDNVILSFKDAQTYKNTPNTNRIEVIKTKYFNMYNSLAGVSYSLK